MLVRYLRAMRPYIESFWTTGEDLGLTQDLVDRAAAEAGLRLLDPGRLSAARRRDSPPVGGSPTPSRVEVDGIGLDELVGGCGVAESVLAALDRAEVPYAGTRVAVQGLGTMGGATARFLARAGLRIVAVADVKGTVANPAGLDVEALLAARDAYGTVDRAALRPGDRELPGDAWLSADAEVLVPGRRLVRGRHRQPGADHGPLDRRGRQHARPAGGRGAARRRAASPYCRTSWSTPVRTPGGGGPCSATSAPTRTRRSPYIRRSMRALIDRMLARAEADGTTPRAAAHAIVADRLPVIAERFGWYAALPYGDADMGGQRAGA